MTMPHLMNCAHMPDGWCLDCVAAQHERMEQLRDAVRSARADEAHCWASRMDALTAQLRDMDARYMALLKAVADGVATQKPPPMLVTAWTCSKCQTDRLKAPCPLGYGAQVDGRCPCVGVALGA